MKMEGEIGKPLPRIDALEKATGVAAFTTDLKLPGMLYAKVLRSPFPPVSYTHLRAHET